MAEFDLTEARLKTEDNFPSLGCLDVQTPKGLIHVHDAPGSMTTMVTHPDGERSVGVLLYDPEVPPGKVQGIISQMSPGSARVMAASLVSLANEIDGGRMDG